MSGTVTVWMDDPYAELAAILMMKRGCTIVGAGTQQRSTPVLQQYHDYSYSNIHLEKIKGPIVRGLLSEDNSINFNSLQSSILYPLIGMTEQEVKQRMTDYARVY